MSLVNLRTAVTAFFRLVTQGSHPVQPDAGFGIFYDLNKQPFFQNSDGATYALGSSSKIVQVLHDETGEYATTANLIPYDDTIPQITEGGEFLTLGVTPTNSSNYLDIEVSLFLAPTVSSWVIVALFDGSADAIAAIPSYVSVNNAGGVVSFKHRMVAGGTSPITFTVRGGNGASGTLALNGASGARKMGGVMCSSITITEVVP